MPYEALSSIVARYAETDRMGVVHHANFLVWMEVGRTDYLAGLGYPYGRIEEGGVLFPLCNVSMRMYHPCHYEDRLLVHTRLARLQSRKVVFEYRVVKGDLLAVSGSTEHICTDKQMKVRKLPSGLFEALGRAMEGDDGSAGNADATV